MDMVNKSKALNILIPRLITKSNYLTNEIKSRMRLNKIFSEFENKASNNLNYFITASRRRYTGSKLGNDLDSIISKTRTKDLNKANNIINDKFYTDSNVETEREKMKYKSSSKIYKDIRDTFDKMKLSLESKFGKNVNKQIQLIIKGLDNKKPIDKNINNENLNEPKIINYNVEQNVNKDKNAINNELDKEQNSIGNEVNKYLNTINSINTFRSPANNSITQSPSPLKKYNFDLPNIKLVNYRKYKFPKQNQTLEEEKKPNIKKLLPYSNIYKFNKKYNKNKEKNNDEKEYKNYPFITEPNYNYVKDPDYHNTVNVVFNSANKEFHLQNDFDFKRKRLENILGINEIPQLNTYDDIAFKKSQTIKNERHKKAEKLSESQQFAALSKKMKINKVIDQDMNLLDKLENKIYKNIMINNKEK
jgi:hypothetical protein